MLALIRSYLRKSLLGRDMRKILITGINGFIGRACAEKFEKEGFAVYGIDIANTLNLDYQIYVRDIVSSHVDDILNEVKPSIIIHCAGAADVNYSLQYPESDFERNVTTLHNILFDMKRCGLDDTRVVFLSSASVYGQPEVLPITEETELNPISPYALHKRMAEDLCLYFNRIHNFDIVIARIFSAYGPGLRKQIFWDMSQKLKSDERLSLFGTGKETRDFIYRDDLIEALYILACSKELKSRIYNVANGEEITINDIAVMFLKENNKSVDSLTFSHSIHEGNPNNWVADISKLKELGYAPKVTIEQGIHNYVEWVRQIQ